MVSVTIKVKKGDKHQERKTLETSSSAPSVLLMGPAGMTGGSGE